MPRTQFSSLGGLGGRPACQCVRPGVSQTGKAANHLHRCSLVQHCKDRCVSDGAPRSQMTKFFASLCSGMRTPSDRPRTKPELRSWHQLVSAMLSGGAEVSDLFQPGHLAGADNPVHMACLDTATHKQVVEWLIFIRFKKVCSLDTTSGQGTLYICCILPGLLMTTWINVLLHSPLCCTASPVPSTAAKFPRQAG